MNVWKTWVDRLRAGRGSRAARKGAGFAGGVPADVLEPRAMLTFLAPPAAGAAGVFETATAAEIAAGVAEGEATIAAVEAALAADAVLAAEAALAADTVVVGGTTVVAAESAGAGAGGIMAGGMFATIGAAVIPGTVLGVGIQYGLEEYTDFYEWQEDWIFWTEEAIFEFASGVDLDGSNFVYVPSEEEYGPYDPWEYDPEEFGGTHPEFQIVPPPADYMDGFDEEEPEFLSPAEAAGVDDEEFGLPLPELAFNEPAEPPLNDDEPWEEEDFNDEDLEPEVDFGSAPPPLEPEYDEEEDAAGDGPDTQPGGTVPGVEGGPGGVAPLPEPSGRDDEVEDQRPVVDDDGEVVPDEVPAAPRSGYGEFPLPSEFNPMTQPQLEQFGPPEEMVPTGRVTRQRANQGFTDDTEKIFAEVENAAGETFEVHYFETSDGGKTNVMPKDPGEQY